MQKEIVEMLKPRHRSQVIIKSLTKVSHSLVSAYSIAGMQFLRDGSSEEHRQRRNANCPHRALTRSLRHGNLSVGINCSARRGALKSKLTFRKYKRLKGKPNWTLNMACTLRIEPQSPPAHREQCPRRRRGTTVSPPPNEDAELF